METLELTLVDVVNEANAQKYKAIYQEQVNERIEESFAQSELDALRRERYAYLDLIEGLKQESLTDEAAELVKRAISATDSVQEAQRVRFGN